MLELRHLRTLSALHSAGSLVRAAQLLNLTQSALSHQIKIMEERYGGPLFERKSVPIAFTATGSRLLALAASVLPTVEQAERDVARLSQGDQGQLRVALECHTCFDWLMPVLDTFRQRWPEVEVDLMPLFHSDPAALLRSGKADLVIGAACGPQFTMFPLFRYEMLAVLAQQHRLASRRRLQATDFEGETVITYPAPEKRSELIRDVLQPAGVAFAHRKAELTAAILQLVASNRGVAALPGWAIKSHVDAHYVLAKPVGAAGLWSDAVASVRPPFAAKAFVTDFVSLIRAYCARELDGISVLT